jgi:predicted small integral membrane protein
MPTLAAHLFVVQLALPLANAAPYISAGAGVAGVLVALGGNQARRHWQRPRLELLPFDVDQGDGVYFDHMDADGIESAWVRLRVHNGGREVAKDVEVYIEILDGQAATSSDRVAAFQKQNQALVVGRRLKWADRDDKTLDIPSGTSRRVDIAHLITIEPRRGDAAQLELPIRFTLDHGQSRIHRNVVAGLAYRLVLSVSGSNFSTELFEIDLEFGGVWLGAASVDQRQSGSLRITHIGARKRL